MRPYRTVPTVNGDYYTLPRAAGPTVLNPGLAGLVESGGMSLGIVPEVTP